MVPIMFSLGLILNPYTEHLTPSPASAADCPEPAPARPF